MRMSFEERVRKFEYQFSDTDDQIIEYILKNREEVVKKSIQDLATHTFVFPNTIVRLAKKMGYEGFSHLKSHLKDEINHENLDEDHLYLYIKKTYDLIDETKLGHISKIFSKAKQIIVFGTGHNASLGEIMVKRFKNMSVPTVQYHFVNEITREITTNFKKEDVVFLISVSGETTEIIKVAQYAKQRNITIISLTHFNSNTLTSLADFNLFFYSPQKKIGNSSIEPKTPMLLAIESLTEFYFKKML